MAGNYEEGWSRIDGEEQAMVVDDGSRIERSGRRFGRLLKEANGSVVSFSCGSENRSSDCKLGVGNCGERGVRNVQIVAR